MRNASLELKRVAIDVGIEDEESIPRMKNKILEMRQRVKELQSLIISRNHSKLRAKNFLPIVGEVHQCPYCWVEHERESNLAYFRKDPDNDEHMVCRVCEFMIFF